MNSPVVGWTDHEIVCHQIPMQNETTKQKEDIDICLSTIFIGWFV